MWRSGRGCSGVGGRVMGRRVGWESVAEWEGGCSGVGGRGGGGDVPGSEKQCGRVGDTG